MIKRRDESFFGMHFDFHAKSYSENIGENLNYKALSRLLEEVKPDYVQCDCKGHPGISSYPTKIGQPANNMKGDILKMWREVTKEHDVALYAHYSGVWDQYQNIKHPEWVALDIEGKPDKFALSVFSPYADEVIIPQLCEIAGEYNLDGVWVDGDCWGAIVDFSDCAKKEYYKRTGKNIDEIKDQFEELELYRNFCREGFREYVIHFCDEVHKKYPKFQICSNWMYSSYAPCEPYKGIDFISGDYSMANSLNTAFFEGRCLQNYEDKPWDLMDWGFNTRCTKSLVQLCQEAASVISLGGGFQIYNMQRYDTFQDWLIDMWKELADFARARQDICHKAKPHHEGCVLFSNKALYNHKANLYRWDSDTNHYGISAHSLLYALLDNMYSVEILMSHQYTKKTQEEINKYAFIALATQDTIEPEIKDSLLKYAENGGNLIITGCNTCKLFENELGVKLSDSELNIAYPNINGKTGYIKTTRVNVKLDGAEVIHTASNEPTIINTNDVISTIIPYGKGHLTGLYIDMDDYQYSKNYLIREMIHSLVQAGYKQQICKIKGSKNIQVILTEKNGKLNVNILNTGGNHSDSRYLNFDEIPPLYDLEISLNLGRKPNSIVQMPENIKTDFTYEDGKIGIKLHKLDIHTVFVLE